MDIERFRQICNSLPGVEEGIKWENHLCFMIAEKMFAVFALEPTETVCSFKCEEAVFHELTEQAGVIPAPYLARYHWVALESFDALSDDTLETLLGESYRLILEKLPKKKQQEFRK